MVENAQPLVLNYQKGTLVLAHNGNLINTDSLREKLEQTGTVFHSTTDSEVLACLIAQARVRTGQVEDAIIQMRLEPFEDLGYARVDHHRALRQGVAEVIYCAGKTAEQTRGIAQAMLRRGAENILLTRVRPEHYAAVRDLDEDVEYHEAARIVVVRRRPVAMPETHICVVTAGTSDLPVAEEAAITAEVLGNRVDRVYDAGVAGLHRLLASAETLMRANALVVVAGMEGALPSVVGGLVDRPVIAVPTSVGYGANFGGLSALLTMLNSCASGISVVNIDNGFGAGYIASQINHTGFVPGNV